MYNWSSKEVKNKEITQSDQYLIWKLEQTINFGLNGKKIKRQELKKFWPQLELDPHKKQFLSLLLWNKVS